ncbi:hypothetical protein PAXINDRAFT_169424, partial [Paxillus involutus ATCC 200175]
VWAEMLWVVQQRLIGTYGFSETLLPPTPDADGSLPPNDCYRPQTFNPLGGQANPLVPKHGNTLLMQLVLDGMRLQPCSPADEVLTGGENACAVWEGFAERRLGVDAAVVGSTPWGGGVRQDVLPKCGSTSPAPEPGDPDEDYQPLLWCWVKERVEKWVPRLP